MAGKLQRVARTSGIPEIGTVADPVVGMTEADAWDDLIDGRGADFHRWRVQTAGICGAAKQSPWRHGEGFRTMELAFGQVLSAENEARLAAETMAMAMAARAKMARKLAAKGNERLPFAWRAILCEGQHDVEATMTLAERMNIDLRLRNIAVIDCGSRDNLPDYIWFCAQLGLKYLAVMDADCSKPDALPNAQAVREAVRTRQGGELAEFPENLETTFSVIKQRPSRAPAAIRALPFNSDMPDPAQALAEVVALAEAIRRLTT